MMRDHAWIEGHIPHQGGMCLLDGVVAWDADHIECKASGHRRADHPLRSRGRLGICTGIEYAAQAMAVHGALLAEHETRPGAGFLTSVRDLQWQRRRLDDLAIDLTVRATRESGNALSMLYSFSLHAGTEQLMSGRATVFVNAAAAPNLI